MGCEIGNLNLKSKYSCYLLTALTVVRRLLEKRGIYRNKNMKIAPLGLKSSKPCPSHLPMLCHTYGNEQRSLWVRVCRRGYLAHDWLAMNCFENLMFVDWFARV